MGSCSHFEIDMSQAFQFSKFRTSGVLTSQFTVSDFKMWLLAVLTGDCIKEIFFIYKKMSGRNNKVTVLRRWP